MTLRPLNILAAVACTGVLLAGSVQSVFPAYNSPNFDEKPFDVDALSLGENDRAEIVGALAALAVNFPDDGRVDDDLREKALAIALSLDPLSAVARAAHRALLTGEGGERVDFFSSLNTISKSLWSHGEKLAARDSEPEDRKLAPFLMEIALVLKSGPEREELWLFGHATNFKPVRWGRLVELQGSAYDSNRQAQLLVREAERLRSPGKGPRPGGPGPRPPRPGGDSGNSGTSNGDGAEVQIRQTAIRFAAHDAELGAIPGEARLDIRPPTEDEKSLFGLFLGNAGKGKDSFRMRLGYDRDGVTITGYERAGDLVKKTWPTWPKNLIGEYTFAVGGPDHPSQVELSLPGALLLESAFSGTVIPPDTAITGSLDEDGSIDLAGPASALARAAGIGGGAVVKVLLMPAVGEAGLADSVTAGDLSVLIRPQVVAYESYDEAKSLLSESRPAELAEAIRKFDEIQNLTTQGMSLDEIAKNSAVQERLENIGELWPGHLSAKIMLAYGTQPVDMRLSPAGSVGRIDNVLKPVAKHYTNSVFGGGTVVGAAEKLVDQARVALRELRPKVHADARGCLNSADRAIDAFDEYFSLTNKSSSRAAQLRRELQEAINELNTARAQLGVTEKIAL